MDKPQSKGLTAVELIAVLVLLAMFAAAVTPAYHIYLDTAEAKSCAETRASALTAYLEFCSLPGNGGTAFSDYADTGYGGADKLCPSGGICILGRQDGHPHLYCTIHEPGDSSGTP